MADVKTIEFPEPLMVGNGVAYTFADFIRWVLNITPEFNNNGKGIRAAVRIEQKLAEGKLILDAEDWTLLRDAAESPAVAYPISPARALLPFLEALN